MGGAMALPFSGYLIPRASELMALLHGLTFCFEAGFRYVGN